MYLTEIMKVIDDYKIDQLKDALPALPQIITDTELHEHQLETNPKPELDQGTTAHAHPVTCDVNLKATLNKNEEVEFQPTTNRISALEETKFFEKVRGVAYWGLESGGKAVTITGSLSSETDWDDQSLTITIHPFEKQHNCPYTLTVTCYTNGATNANLKAYPSGGETGITIYHDSLEEMDVSSVQDSLDDYKPYGASRVNELIKDCGFTKMRARVAYLRETGCTHEEISTKTGVSEGASRSYISKSNTETKQALNRVICTSEPRKRILSKATFPSGKANTVQWRYLCQEVNSEQIWLLTVEQQRTSAENDEDSISITSEAYNRIGEISRVYDLIECPSDEAMAWEELFDRVDTGYIHEDCIEPLLRALQRR